MGKRARQRLFVLAAAATFVGLLAVPASADPPNIGEPTTEPFNAWNPCLGVLEVHTITFTPFDHFHSNNAVIQDKDRHGFTESGFLLNNARFHVVDRFDGGVSVELIDVWRNPDTRDMFHAVGIFRIVGNAHVIDEFTLTCITGPTIPEP